MSDFGFDLSTEIPGITVRTERDGIQTIPTPVGFSSVCFRHTVAAVYTYFTNHGTLPSVAELHKAWPDYSVKTYASLFLTPELKQALEYRGVAWNSSLGLTLEQQNVLMLLADPTDRRNLGTKLKLMGVPMPRYLAWLKNPLFAEHLNKVTKAAYEDFLPAIRQVLVGNALNGDDKAIERIFQMTGEWNPAAQSVQDSKQVVMSVIEAVIRHVTDLDTRKAILADVQAAVVSYDIVQPRSLER